jgi:hypothetical protein
MPRRIHQLKVSLEGAESPIWRRILVSGLRYCLCLVGHTLEYRDGPWKYSIALEAIQHVEGRFPWQLVGGVGVCPAPPGEAAVPRAARNARPLH